MLHGILLTQFNEENVLSIIRNKTLETFYSFFVSNVLLLNFAAMNDELKSILIKVKCLYSKYGIKSVTMDDVSRELGISKKTLYQYVKDKNELVELVMEVEIGRYDEIFQTLYSKNLNAIEELFEVHKLVSQMIKESNPSQEYDLRKYYPELYGKICQVRRDRMYNNTVANMRKGKAEGVYRSDFNEEILAKVQLIRLDHSMKAEIFTPEEMTSACMFHEFFVYHIRGIASEEGLKVLEKKLIELENA